MEQTTKHTFLSRLSTFILAKAVFVFAGLAIILSQPDHGKRADAVLSQVAGEVRGLGEEIAALELTTSSPLTAAELSRLTDQLARKSQVTAFQLLARDSVGQVQPVFTHYVAGKEEDEDEDAGRLGGREQLDQARLQALLALPNGYEVPVAIEGDEAVFVRRLDLANGTPSLLVASARHHLFISDRTSLVTILMVLFVSSALVSLLLVSLIRKRLQVPLQRLIDGMEKTARGEPSSFEHNPGDREIEALGDAFNSMSAQLLKQRRDLIEYTDRLKESNEQLLDSQLFLAALVDSTPLCVLATSPAGDIILCNRTAAEEFGYQPDAVLGENIANLIVAPGQLDPTPQAANQAQAFEARCRRKNEGSFPAYVISASTRDEAGRVLANIYIIRDITESRSFQEMMIRLDRYYTRGEMAGDIAHEINNYLAILSGNIELMPMILRKGDTEKIERKLGVMKDTADKIARFTDGLMDGPHEDAVFEPTDLNQLVANVLAFLKPQNKFDYVTIEMDLSGDLPLVEVDTGQLQQLLVNFIYNAAEAMETQEGDRLITIRTSLVGLETDGRVRIEVIDNGPGVDDDKRAMLFKKRFTTKRRGHGIGLITCQRIADAHGGLVAHDRSDVTVFSCTIPIHHREENEAEASAISPHDVADPSLAVDRF